MNTLIRGLETFLAVFFSAFFTQVTVSGEPLDVTSPDGQSRLLSSLMAAFLLAARQWTAVRSKNGNGKT